MAYLNQEDEEEMQGQGLNQALTQPQGQTQPQQEQSQEAPQQSTGSAMIGGDTTQPSAPMPQQKQQKAGTGTFTNLRNYLQANQGNRVSSAAAQRVANVGAGAQKSIGQAQSAFGKRVEQGSLANMGTARQEAADITKVGTQATYQAPQAPAPQSVQSTSSVESVIERDKTVPTTSTQIKPYDPSALADYWKDKTINADGTVTYKDGTPVGTQVKNTQTTTPAAPAQTSPFSDDQITRFAEIINAQYKGPQSLQQAGLYEPSAQKVRTAAQAAKQTQSAAGREQLLKETFGRNRDYTRGQNKLDALLLNTSGEGVRSLQDKAKTALEAQKFLDQAQSQSFNLASQRAKDIAAIKEGARADFTGTRAEVEKATDERLSQVVRDWDKLPEYFRNLLRNTVNRNKDNTINDLSALENARYNQWVGSQAGGSRRGLSAEEARILGLSQGQSLFNISPDAIKATQAYKDRLITKDELSRQLALAQLANLAQDNALKKDLLYTDMSKAGTQNILQSIDQAAFQRQLGELQKRGESALNRLEKESTVYIPGLTDKVEKTSGRRNDYSGKDLLYEFGGYTPSTSPGAGLASDSSIQDELSKIISGSSYTPGRNTNVENFAEELYRGISSGRGDPTRGKLANIHHSEATTELLQPLQEQLIKQGFEDRVQLTENAQTKARGQALRQLLESITKGYK